MGISPNYLMNPFACAFLSTAESPLRLMVLIVDKTDEEVGVAFIGIKTPYKVVVERFEFGQPREKFLVRAANKALELLRKEILENVEK